MDLKFATLTAPSNCAAANLVRKRSEADRIMPEPADFHAAPRYCPLVSNEWFWFEGRWSKRWCDDKNTLEQDARDQTGILYGQAIASPLGNNVGISLRELVFRINGLLPMVRSEGGRID